MHAYEEWGEECFHRFNGMWALALWDARRRLLLCSRDRYGIKPLVYTETPARVRVRVRDQGAARARRRRAGGERRRSSTTTSRTASSTTPRETFFRGVRIAAARPPAARHARSDGGARSRVVRAAGRDRRATRGAEERFAELFTDATSLRLVSDVPGRHVPQRRARLVRDRLHRRRADGAAARRSAARRSRRRSPRATRTTRASTRGRSSPRSRAPAAPSGTTSCRRASSSSPTSTGCSGTRRSRSAARASTRSGASTGSRASEGVTVTLDGQGGDEVVGGYPQQLSPFLHAARAQRARCATGRARRAPPAATRSLARARDDRAARGALWSLPGAVQRAAADRRRRCAATPTG